MNVRRVRIGAAVASLAVVAGLSLPLPALADDVAAAQNAVSLETVAEEVNTQASGDAASEASEFQTNLKGDYTTYGDGTATVTANGLVAASNGGDYLVRWQEEDASVGDMVYSADVTFESADVDGAASLVLHSDANDMDSIQAYVANINPKTGECRLFKFENTANEGHISYNMIPSFNIGAAVSKRFHLSVTTIGKHMVYTVQALDEQGNVTASHTASTADFTLGDEGNNEEVYAHYGQNTALREGFCGVLSFNASVTYQNLTATPLAEENTPQLANLNITGDAVDMPFAFQDTAYVYSGYVHNSAQEVTISYETENANASVVVTDDQGNTYTGENGTVTVPVTHRGSSYRNEGLNLYTLTVTDSASGAEVVYKLRVFGENPDDTYYWEDQRDQFHYSVKNGWGNDPCGLVKTSDGVYHFYYQAYTDTDWGPMHWGYATSTDLVHWKQQPLALYPDEYGAQFSGCGVYANHETAPEIFDEGEEGMVFIVTANGREGQDGKQRLTLAYAKYDQSAHTMGAYQKYDDVLLDYSTDDIITPADGAFRDPKVFRFDNKWFLIVAGGPVRFYSSDDLIHWKGESYLNEPNSDSHVNTECPDLYPVKAEDGTVKWILSRGGSYYKVGQFEKVGTTNVEGGEYAFVQDEGTPDYTMNFGRDAYAAMTYFNQGTDFGTSGNVNCPELVAMNWMNTWDYNKLLQNTGNYTFNGTYNLPVELGLTKASDGTYRLTQDPVANLDTLRDTDNAVTVSDMKLGQDATVTPLDFHGTTYEIEATFMPDEGSTPTVGFNVRVGSGEKTRLSYDFATDTITLDRSQSGFILNGAFSTPRSQADVEHNADGSITLHVYVDSMSIEAFTGDYAVAGANQIFPSPASDGLEAFSENGTATLDATVYPLASIWDGQRSENPSTAPECINLSQDSISAYVGEVFDVSAYISPARAEQGITFTVDDPSVAKVEQTDGGFRVTTLKQGSAKITVTSTADPSLTRTLEVGVHEDNFKTNVSGVENPTNGFYADGETLYTDSIGANSFLYSDVAYPVAGSTYSIDVQFKTGLANLIWGMQSEDPYQGCYAVQFRGAGQTLRLFNFQADHTYTDQGTPVPEAADGSYHVTIQTVKADDGSTQIIATVNGTECLNYTLAEGDPVYTEGRVAIGMWDSDQTTFTNWYLDDATALPPLRTALEAAIANASQLDQGAYAPEAWNAFQGVIDLANSLVDDENATADQLMAAQTALETAQTALQQSVKDVLQAAVTAAKSIAQGDFSDETWNALQQAITNAQGVVDNASASNEDVTNAQQALLDAIKGLKTALVFTDVSADTPHAEDIQWMADNGLAQGYLNPDGRTYHFSGMDTMKRQDMAAFLHRLADFAGADLTLDDELSFVDVTDETPHADDIRWLAATGVSEGWTTPEGQEFRGMGDIVRQDMAAFLYRLAGSPEFEPTAEQKAAFTDVTDETPHAKEIWWLAANGVSEGWQDEDGTAHFSGMSTVVRQDMAAFLHRLYEKGLIK